MKQIVKNNVVLIAGICLPLALMLIFTIAGVISRASAADPQYDMVVMSNNDVGGPWHVAVEGGKLFIRHTSAKANVYDRSKPVLYRFNHKTLKAEVLNIDYDHVVDGVVKDPAIDAINQDRLVTTAISPDGYQLGSDNSGRSGLFQGIFGGQSYRTAFVLQKNSRTIPVQMGGDYYYFGSPTNVFWIVGAK